MVNKLQRHALKRPMKEKVSKRVGQTADLMVSCFVLFVLFSLESTTGPNKAALVNNNQIPVYPGRFKIGLCGFA